MLEKNPPLVLSEMFKNKKPMLFAVEFPGSVENHENGIRSLGGLQNIAEVVFFYLPVLISAPYVYTCAGIHVSLYKVPRDNNSFQQTARKKF